MKSEPGEHVDERLREAFRVDDTAAGRVTRRALASQLSRPTPTSRLAPLGLAALTACAVTTVWLFRPVLAPVPAPGAERSVAAPYEAVELSGSLVDGVLILPIPDGSIVIAGPGRREDRPPDGYGIVMVEGEVR